MIILWNVIPVWHKLESIGGKCKFIEDLYIIFMDLANTQRETLKYTSGPFY